MQNIGSKVLCVFEATVMEIIGPEGAPLAIVQDADGMRFKLKPDCLLDGSVVMSINSRPSDTVDDQFTGDDLGGLMAAAERGEPPALVSCATCKHAAPVEGDLSVILCPMSHQYRHAETFRSCPDFVGVV